MSLPNGGGSPKRCRYLGELGPGAGAPGNDALLAIAQQLAYQTQLHDILTA